MTEIWKDIDGYREIYQVSNLGHVRTKDRKGTRGYFVKSHTLSQCENNNGYLRVRMHLKDCSKGKDYFVHILVAQLFLPKVEGKDFVNHKDGDKYNNAVDNLEWCTRSENEQHAWRTGLKNKQSASRKGEQHGMHKLTQEDVDWIRKHHVPWDKQFGSKPLAEMFGVRPQTITDIVNNRTWINLGVYSDWIIGENNE